MIELIHVSKTFVGKEGRVEALKDICLEIGRGQICGIIGMSGAGKSTLVRCLNYLEKPTSGRVLVDGQDLSLLNGRQLRALRRDVSMIFQHFHLLMQRTVLDNVCFPMEIAGKGRREARARALELLETVGLSDKAGAYPAQLSGGQKQRVAIARALANNPKVLLCDEATSALDPATTKSILALLQQINRDFGITIVIITHEMSVVQEICSHVAIVDAGVLAESGQVAEVFAKPKSMAAKKLVFMANQSREVMEGKRCIRVVFDGESSFQPVVANMVLLHKEPVNILLANTKDIGGKAYGQMVLQLPVDEDVADRMIAYLGSQGLEVEELAEYVE